MSQFLSIENYHIENCLKIDTWKLKIIGGLLSVVLVLFSPALALAVEIDIPKPDGFVTDVAHKLIPATEQALESKLAAYEKQTGTELAVLIVPLIPEGLSANEYATKVGNSWGVGKAKVDNGALLLIETDDAPGQKDVYIATGSQLEGALPDLVAKRITDGVMIPLFRAGDFDGGVTAGVDAMIAAIKGESFTDVRMAGGNLTQQRADEPLSIGVIITLVLIFILLPVGWILGRSKSWWGGGMLGALGGAAIAHLLALDPLMTGLLSLGLGGFGLGFDYVMSKNPTLSDACGTIFIAIISSMGRGRGGGGSSGGGFGGFGGGGFSGGGGGGKW